VASQLCSGRAACRFLKVSRSTYWYRSKEQTSQEQRLLKRLTELSEKHARYGYRRIAALLRQEGWQVGKRHVQRLRRSIGLRVPPTKRKMVGRGVSTGLPTKAEHRGHVWSWDFISDATTRGGEGGRTVRENQDRGTACKLTAERVPAIVSAGSKDGDHESGNDESREASGRAGSGGSALIGIQVEAKNAGAQRRAGSLSSPWRISSPGGAEKEGSPQKRPSLASMTDTFFGIQLEASAARASESPDSCRVTFSICTRRWPERIYG
jgi:hypothetical protein